MHVHDKGGTIMSANHRVAYSDVFRSTFAKIPNLDIIIHYKDIEKTPYTTHVTIQCGQFKVMGIE